MRQRASVRLLAATVASAVVALAAIAAPAARVARAGDVDDGKKLLKERQWSKAADAFRAALKDSPSSRDAALGLATAAAEGQIADAYDPATAAASAALKSRPDDREMRLAYGNLFLARAAIDDRWRADAQEQFQRLLKANADDVEATIGLARYYAQTDGNYPRAIELLDGAIAKKPGNAGAHLAKGTLLYDEAEKAYKAGNAALASSTFQKAAEALEVATKAEPTRADAWMKLAYTRHYLVASDPGSAEKAQAAYLKALDADPSDGAPLRGLQSLLSGTPGKYGELFAKLVKEKPKSAAVLYEQAKQLKAAGRVDEAVAAMKSHVALSHSPYLGWFEIGELLREKGDDEGAKRAYTECLRAAPTSGVSSRCVHFLTVELQTRGRDAVQSYEEIKKVQKAYEDVLALSPKDMLGNNNVAFFLREAFKSPAGHGHADLFEACVAHYVTACETIGEFQPAYLSLAYGERHGFAQILNDTGLMFDSEAITPDLVKAESYYRRAMDWTEYGYWDAYGNERKLLEKQGRTQDALDWAEACAEGIKREDGSPQNDYRRICQGDAERLRKQLGK